MHREWGELPVTATAGAQSEGRTWCRNPLVIRLEHIYGTGEPDATLASIDARPNFLARHRVPHEDGVLADMADAMTTVHHRPDGDDNLVTDRKGVSHPDQPLPPRSPTARAHWSPSRLE